jgi:hypothetical protein
MGKVAELSEPMFLDGDGSVVAVKVDADEV